MGRIIVANRRGHQVVEWSTTDTEEARATVEEAERILREARAAGCAISKKVDGVHVLDRGAFDPDAEEYQIVAPSPAANRRPSVRPATARPRACLHDAGVRSRCPAARRVWILHRMFATPPVKDADDDGIAEATRRLLDWLRQGLDEPDDGT